jgi:transcriptional regulator with XRE-family HTH domain
LCIELHPFQHFNTDYMTISDYHIQDLSKTIVGRREVLGITQEQLSKLSKVGMKTIYKLEQGVGNPSLDTIEKVLDILGLELRVKLKK